MCRIFEFEEKDGVEEKDVGVEPLNLKRRTVSERRTVPKRRTVVSNH